MPNFDGVWEVRIIYDSEPTGFPLIEHTLTFDVLAFEDYEAGTPFDDIRIFLRDGTNAPLFETIDALVAGFIGIYSGESTFIRAELWKIPEGTFAGTFVSTYPINEPGVSVTNSVPAQQLTYTFRSIGGGSGRLQLMEPAVAGNSKTSYPYGSAALNAIPDFVTAAAGAIVARDNTFMFANIHLSLGQNERLFRKRYRQ